MWLTYSVFASCQHGSNTILYTVTAVVLYSDCTCPPRIGLFKEHITHVHECIANATAAANWPVIG